ncbi:sulfite exporter TauE/SafE family protein [Candidatus Chloroploca sp. Khr17]|uniref:sulfite exporter TauE/SafE family protein n=1 Tax=Candidatus Chloroploca sp. Khr17 TaxID=2496869 RepID=UPI00101D7FD1|nr:sulfite exporter TauE/SafE family protein [Candidatus Chloroploca sp. Khr17]
MELWQLGLLFLAALVAGAINSVAGGGSFISFPALLLVGVPPIAANATNTTALWPGIAASVGAYRRELSLQKRGIMLFSGLSMLGGLIGALLLLRTREAVFTEMIPYLLLLATLVFAFSPWLTAQARRLSHSAENTPGQRFVILGIYLSIAVYGGFFGAGLGILTLAVLSLMGQENIHEMNALKTLQATLINGIAVAAFILAGIVEWPMALIMILGAIIGGYGGAAIARKLDPLLVRRLVIALSVSLTIYFFVV